MKLNNFSLVDSIGLQGLGHYWDLHNWADFTGFDLICELGAVRLAWELIPEAIAKGEGFGEGNAARRCSLRFDGVYRVEIRRAKSIAEEADSRTLHSIELAPSNNTLPDGQPQPIGSVATGSGKRAMRFQFMSGFDIEVFAESATLESDE